MYSIIVLYSHSSHIGIIEGFTKEGCKIKPIHYGIAVKSIFELLIGKLITKGKLLQIKYNKKIQSAIIQYLKGDVDFVLVLKGHRINKKTEKLLIKHNVPIILWTTDSFHRAPFQSTLIPFCLKVFFQDGADLSFHKSGEWLPLGFDEEVFQVNNKKTIDVLMLGNLKRPNYNLRRNFFYEISNLGKQGLNVVFIGYNVDQDLQKQFEISNVKNMGSLGFIKYIEVISKSKIIVNIHQDDGGQPLNPLFFGIPAIGGIQITDDREYFKKWLVPEKSYFPTDIQNVNQRIINLLNNNIVINENVIEEIRANHSYQARSKRFIQAFKNFQLKK